MSLKEQAYKCFTVKRVLFQVSFSQFGIKYNQLHQKNLNNKLKMRFFVENFVYIQNIYFSKLI